MIIDSFLLRTDSVAVSDTIMYWHHSQILGNKLLATIHCKKAPYCTMEVSVTDTIGNILIYDSSPIFISEYHFVNLSKKMPHKVRRTKAE